MGEYCAVLRGIDYNLYVEQKSPYRSDAETLINRVNKEMKKQGKEAIFNEILKKNHISPE